MTNPFSELSAQISDLQRQLEAKNTAALPEWMDIDALSAFTGYQKSTIYKKKMLGEIPYYKMGKKLMFRRSEIEALILRSRSSYGGVKVEE